MVQLASLIGSPALWQKNFGKNFRCISILKISWIQDKPGLEAFIPEQSITRYSKIFMHRWMDLLLMVELSCGFEKC